MIDDIHAVESQGEFLSFGCTYKWMYPQLPPKLIGRQVPRGISGGRCRRRAPEPLRLGRSSQRTSSSKRSDEVHVALRTIVECTERELVVESVENAAQGREGRVRRGSCLIGFRRSHRGRWLWHAAAVGLVKYPVR
jgi:hypothetical protein